MRLDHTPRRIRSCTSSDADIGSESAAHNLVDPSTSVNKNVTLPDGRSFPSCDATTSGVSQIGDPSEATDAEVIGPRADAAQPRTISLLPRAPSWMGTHRRHQDTNSSPRYPEPQLWAHTSHNPGPRITHIWDCQDLGDHGCDPFVVWAGHARWTASQRWSRGHRERVSSSAGVRRLSHLPVDYAHSAPSWSKVCSGVSMPNSRRPSRVNSNSTRGGLVARGCSWIPRVPATSRRLSFEFLRLVADAGVDRTAALAEV